MDSDRLPALRHYFNRCKPDAPVPVDDPDDWYVDFDAQGLRGERCITTIASTIELAEAPTCQLFTGFSGSGKTSELLRLRRMLEGNGYFVVYADAVHTIDLQTEVSYADVLVALGLATSHAIDAAGKKGAVAKWSRRFGEEIKTLLFSDLSLGGLKGKVGSSEMGLELKENPSFRLDLRTAATSKRRQLLEQVRAFFTAADTFVRENGSPEGLVVILDNLEKLSSGSSVQSSAKTMFVSDSEALRAPQVHLIYTLPARVVFSSIGPELGKLYDGEPLVLPMVKFTDRQKGQPFKKGRDAMRELLLRRLDFKEVFGSKAAPVDALVNHSGGYARDLLRLAQYSLQIAGALPVTEAHVEASVAKLKRSYVRGYSTAYTDLLEYIGQNRPTVIPAELRGALEEVIDGHFAIIYGNDDDWYDIHPLITGVLQESKPVAAALPPSTPALLPGRTSSPLPVGAPRPALPPRAAAKKGHEPTS